MRSFSESATAPAHATFEAIDNEDDGIDLDALARVLPHYVGAGPRYTSYPTVPNWEQSFRESDHATALECRDHTSDLSLYVHVPFCKSLCHFCACNRVITQDPALPERYLGAIDMELDTIRERLNGTLTVSQLHWGGGTPTHLNPNQLERLFRSTSDRFPLAPGAEVSIEMDPRVTTADQIAVLADCGFNRISLGVQDTNPKTQEAIHRIQPFELTRNLTELARASGIDRVNFDLIYGLPHQTTYSFERTLDAVISAEPDRIALYGYAHVSWLAKQQRGFERFDLPTPALRVRIQLLAIRRLLEAGYRFIGMDHFAKPEDEICRALDSGTLRRNFMGYTTLDGVDVIACGPSGISDLSSSYIQCEKGLPAWFEAVEAGRLATARGHRLSLDDEARRWIIGRIMCQGHVSARECEIEFGGCFREDYARSLARLEMLEHDGLVELSATGGFRVTSIGRLFLRNVAMAFDAYLDTNQLGIAKQFSQTV